MLLCVVGVFFVCHVLALVANILEVNLYLFCHDVFIASPQHLGTSHHALTQTNNLLVTFNSSINFIIYCIFSDRFKEMLVSLLCSLVGREHLRQQHVLLRNRSCLPEVCLFRIS